MQYPRSSSLFSWYFCAIFIIHLNLFPLYFAQDSGSKLTSVPATDTSKFNSSKRTADLQSTSNTTTSFIYNKTENGVLNDYGAVESVDRGTKTFDIQSWIPEKADRGVAVNLTILPVLAMLAFLILLCLKGCTWCRESTKDRERDGDAEGSFIILREGDEEYHDIDFRSDLSTPYDTYSSYMSFLRRNNNYDTVTSVRSLGSRPYDTVTSYRSLVLQRLDSGNMDSVTSYRAFLQRMKQTKDMDVQVELLEDSNRNGVERLPSIRRPHRSNSTSPRLKSKMHHEHSNGSENSNFKSSQSEKDGSNGVKRHDRTNKRHYERSPTRQTKNKSPVQNICDKDTHQRKETNQKSDQAVSKNGQEGQRIPRFRVSFVTDNERTVNDAQTNNTPSKPETGKLSP